MKLHPYLHFNGNCRQAFAYYEQHLGGKILGMMTYDQMPPGAPVPAGMEKAVVHVRMALGETLVMAGDAPPDRFDPMQGIFLSLDVTSDAEAERVHAALAEGGTVIVPMEETFYASRFSMVRDQFGVSWMVIHEKPMS
jgi:PhnB protein